MRLEDADKPTIMAFLDVRRAYDRTWRSGLLHRLHEQIGIHGKMFRMCCAMLQSVRRRVLVNNEKSDPFSVLIGLPQGAVLSPLLYTCFINGLIENLKQHELGVVIPGGTRVPALLYADDIVLLAGSVGEMHSMLEVVGQYAAKWQFRFNGKKSGIVCCVNPKFGQGFKTRVKAVDWRLGEEQLPVLDSYKYLGLQMGQHPAVGKWRDTVDLLKEKAEKQANRLCFGVAGNRHMPFQTSVMLFNAYVRPVFEYGQNIWAAMASETAMNEIEEVQYHFGKRLLKCEGRPAKLFVRWELGWQSVRTRALIAALNFFGKLSSMGMSRLAGVLFRIRCAQVDHNSGMNSWCRFVKEKLFQNGFSRVWRQRAVPADWKRLVKDAARRFESSLAQAELARHPELRLWAQLKSKPCLERWAASGRRHPGVVCKMRLRANIEPLLARIAENHSDWPYHRSLCLLCSDENRSVENVTHFVGQCGYYLHERRNFVTKVVNLLQVAGVGMDLVPQQWSPLELTRFILGDLEIRGISGNDRLRLDRTCFDYLKVISRKRKAVWEHLTEPNEPWKLLT
jgi:hypothetical protein